MSVPQYVKNAQNNYNAKFDLIQLKLPKGTKDRIRSATAGSMSMAEYCKRAVLSVLETSKGKPSTEHNKLFPNTSQTAQISPTKEEREEITSKPGKAVNKANKEPFDIYAVQAELDARREEVKAHKDSGEEPEEATEPVGDIPGESGESDELTDRLNAMKAYRKQVVKEREKYGEASDDLIKDFVEKVEKEGEDITSPEYQERIRKAIGTVNLDRVNAYLKSIGRMQEKSRKERTKEKNKRESVYY